MLQMSANRRAMLFAATMVLATANSAAAQSGISIDYEDRIYIRYADGNSYFIAPESSAGRSGSVDNRVALKIKNDPNTPGKPIRHYDIVALETEHPSRPGYVRAYMSSQQWVYFDTAKGPGEAPEQWWRILRKKGDGVVEQGDVVFFQNRYNPHLHLSSVQNPPWLTCPTNQCPYVLELVEPKKPKVVISNNARPTDPDFINDVVFVENPGSSSTQSISQTWSLSETQAAQIGSEATKQWETGVSISTEYEALVFKGEVELSASYGQALTEQRSQVMESNVQKSVTGNYSAPARGWAFHTIKIKIPYKVYDATGGGLTLQMRKFSGQLEVSRGRVIEIPNRDENGNIEPVPLGDVQEVLQLYAAKDPDEVRDILKPGGLLQQWQAKGYVTGGSYTPPSPKPNPSPMPTPTPMIQLTVNSVVGTYQRNPVENGWHVGQIAPGPNNTLIWSNREGIQWTLTPDFAAGVLRTGGDNPYASEGNPPFTIEVENGAVAGIRFRNDSYRRVSGNFAPAPHPQPNPNPNPMPQPQQLNLASILGAYQRTPVENGWHSGRITAGPNNNLIWTNQEGIRWNLSLDLGNKQLRTGGDNPYASEGNPPFTLEVQNGNVVAFNFRDERYQRVGNVGPAPNPNPMPAPGPIPQLTREALLGSYERTPVEDPWHQGRISNGPNGTLQWTNSAGVRWTLTPDLANKMLRTGADNPYVNDGIRDFTIESSGANVTGFRFNGELYRRLP